MRARERVRVCECTHTRPLVLSLRSRFSAIADIQRNQGLALQDILRDVHEFVHRYVAF